MSTNSKRAVIRSSVDGSELMIKTTADNVYMETGETVEAALDNKLDKNGAIIYAPVTVTTRAGAIRLAEEEVYPGLPAAGIDIYVAYPYDNGRGGLIELSGTAEGEPVRVNGIGDPVREYDAANKKYVDDKFAFEQVKLVSPDGNGYILMFAQGTSDDDDEVLVIESANGCPRIIEVGSPIDDHDVAIKSYVDKYARAADLGHIEIDPSDFMETLTEEGRYRFKDLDDISYFVTVTVLTDGYIKQEYYNDDEGVYIVYMRAGWKNSDESWDFNSWGWYANSDTLSEYIKRSELNAEKFATESYVDTAISTAIGNVNAVLDDAAEQISELEKLVVTGVE